jgi:hypothetical protein
MDTVQIYTALVRIGLTCRDRAFFSTLADEKCSEALRHIYTNGGAINAAAISLGGNRDTGPETNKPPEGVAIKRRPGSVRSSL